MAIVFSGGKIQSTNLPSPSKPAANPAITQLQNFQAPLPGFSGGSTPKPSGGGGGSSSPQPNNSPSPSSGSSAQTNLPNLDSLYAPIFAAYDNMTNQVNANQTQDTTDLTSSYNQNKGLIPGYQASAQSTIDANQLALQNQTQSAYDQAARNYQWANAGAMNQYGFNGAYLGANSMAQQEMQRETGQVGQQAIQGQQQIGTQNLDLKNWVNQQNATLDQQFSSAKDQLSQFFQQQLLAITNDRVQTEQQKAAGKIQLLEDVLNQNNQIAMQYNGFQQQLQLLQATGGQNYNSNLAPFLSNMGTLGSQINQNVSPANQSYGVAMGQGQQAPVWTTQPSQTQNNDYVNQLLGGTGTSAGIPQTGGLG